MEWVCIGVGQENTGDSIVGQETNIFCRGFKISDDGGLLWSQYFAEDTSRI